MNFLVKEIDGLRLAASSIASIKDGDLDTMQNKVAERDILWTLVKLSAMHRYMKSYLGKLRRYIPGIHLNFVGLGSGPGMRALPLPSTRDELVVPDPVLLAAYRASFGNDSHFDTICAFNRDPKIRRDINAWLKSMNGEFQDESNYTWYVPGLKRDEVWEADAAVLNILLKIKKIRKKYVNTLFHVNNQELDVNLDTLKKVRKLGYVDLVIDYPARRIDKMYNAALLDQFDPAWDVLTKFFGTSLPKEKDGMDLPSIYKNQLKRVGYDEIEQISIKSKGRVENILFFCLRKPVVELTRMASQYNKNLPALSGRILEQLLGNGSSPSFNLMDFLERQKAKNPPAIASGTPGNGLKILIYKKNEGWGAPLGMLLDEMTWKNILSIHAFDRLKINKELIVLKKKITKTDLNLKSACIQGKIRQKLNISILEKRPIYLLDRCSNEYSDASFPADGRLDGTAFWLRLYGDELQHGNFVFLSKLEDREMIVVVIDHYMQQYPLIKTLRQFHAYCMELKENNLEFMNRLND